MKKTLTVLLSACLLLSCSACGKKAGKEDSSAAASSEATATATATATAEASASSAEATSTPVPPSANKEVVSDDRAPNEIYWLMSDSNNLTYHLKNCKEIEGKDAQKVDWNLVKTIGLRQCPECNPPQYEGYTDAE